MKPRAGYILCACLLAFASRSARVAADDATPATPRTGGAESAQCGGAELEPVPSNGFPLTPARSRELWTNLGLMGDWSPHASMKPGASVGFEWVPLVNAKQSVRLGLYAGLTFGHVGDESHAVVGGELGPRLRLSPLINDFFDIYPILKTDLALAIKPWKSVFRPGLGVGVRVLRAVSLEATFDGLVAIGDPFAGGSRLAPGMTIALGFDWCAPYEACNRPPPPPPTQRSLTCELYAQASAVCKRSAQRAALCEAVAIALDANAVATAERFDAIDAFLEGMLEHAADATLKQELSALQVQHRKLLKKIDDAREAERKAAQHSAWLPVHCSYAPVAAELREAFGCDAQSRPVAACSPVPGCEP
jgi:hypothetical protein